MARPHLGHLQLGYDLLDFLSLSPKRPCHYSPKAASNERHCVPHAPHFFLLGDLSRDTSIIILACFS